MILSIIAAASISASCVWDAPRGTHAVTDVKPSSLVDNYKDIPAAVRQRLKTRMDALRYDEVTEIRRGSITGTYAYSGLRDMHFGARGDKVCREVSMTNWSPTDVERALVYCEDGHCIAVPTVCRNVSRITRGALIVPVPADPPVTARVVKPIDLDAPSVTDTADITAPYAAQVSPLSGVPTLMDLDVPGASDGADGQMSSQTFDDQLRPVLPPWVSLSWPGVPLVPSPLWSVPPLPLMPPGARVPVVPGIPGEPSVNVPVGGVSPMAEPIPEPSTWALMLLGLVGVIVAAKRRVA